MSWPGTNHTTKQMGKDSVTDHLKDIKDDVKDAAKDAKDEIVDRTKDAKETVSDKAKELKDKMTKEKETDTVGVKLAVEREKA
ncbi:hypothetical protein J8273_4777 [Carpediemonas membranifera]|uniref:Uncharacterized protein n=1 Tax=Carpediemonas membranifera TaxID=201153 RepID=A0A8J6ATF5_9EUKA|nr:hypothetical protein J8273_4777 [Carpediemonas membranifera]|eukprot:KAG9393658.1 hypothetical protein J8273_4777 [Carpediemonas membranifera]